MASMDGISSVQQESDYDQGLTNGDAKSPSSPFSGSINQDVSSSSPRSSTSLMESYQDPTSTLDTQNIQNRIDNSEESSLTNNTPLQTVAPVSQPDIIGERSTRTGYVYDVRMRFHSNVHGDEDHPEDPRRIWKIYDALKTSGCINRMIKVPSREATIDELNYVHTLEHIDSINSTTELCNSVATGQVLNGVAIVRPPGHHAEPDEAGGDVHHGNGTQKAFIDDPDVVYCSIHRYDDGSFYPGDPVTAAHTTVGEGAGLGRNINIPWPCSGMGDSEYIYAFNKVVMPIVYEFAPDFILVSAGFDAAKGDHIGENLVTPAAYGHMTHMLKSLANGKIILALEGGYNLESIAVSGLACTKALLSDPVEALEPIIPNEICVQTIHEVMEVQSRYWKSITPMYIDPVDDEYSRSNIVKLSKVLSIYRTEFLYERHKMLKLPLSNPTYETNFLDNVHITPNLSHTKNPLYIFVHDVGEFCARTMGASNILRPEKSALVDPVARYVDRIVTSDNELIDIVIPYQPASEDEKISLKEKATELLTDIWDNYAVVAGGQRRIILIGVGFGCHSLVSLMNERQKDVTRLVSCAVLVPGGDHVLPMVTRRLSTWYADNSLVFISDDHPAWEVTNPKMISRTGNIVQLGKSLDNLSDQLLYVYNSLFDQLDKKLVESTFMDVLPESGNVETIIRGRDEEMSQHSQQLSMPSLYQNVHDSSARISRPHSPLSQSSPGVGSSNGSLAPSVTRYSSSSPASPSSPLVDRVSVTAGNASQRSQPYPSPNSRSHQLQHPQAKGSPSSLLMHQYDQHSRSPHQDFSPSNHVEQDYTHRQVHNDRYN
ncbi:Histone deacetylase hda1 [Entomortierella lignicola]|nr:Histone deacetylase hda1 [Entomortierella lignicola]